MGHLVTPCPVIPGFSWVGEVADPRTELTINASRAVGERILTVLANSFDHRMGDVWTEYWGFLLSVEGSSISDRRIINWPIWLESISRSNSTEPYVTVTVFIGGGKWGLESE